VCKAFREQGREAAVKEEVRRQDDRLELPHQSDSQPTSVKADDAAAAADGKPQPGGRDGAKRQSVGELLNLGRGFGISR
jgi:hypothetical protein